MRIVIVEDNTTNLAVLCRLVGKTTDIVCIGFTEPSLALADMMLFQCDLAIVEYFMPDGELAYGGVGMPTPHPFSGVEYAQPATMRT